MNTQVSKDLNKYLANIGVFYVKLHNLHWNIEGKDFKQVHEYLEEMYDEFNEKFDEIAELLKQYEVFPHASMKEYLEVSDIEELDSKPVRSTEALEIVLADIKKFVDLATSIRQTADENDEFLVVSAMEDELTGYLKTVWFIKSMLK